MNASFRHACPLICVIGCLCGCVAAAEEAGQLNITVSSADGAALPCRVHLLDPDGTPVLKEDLPAWRDHFVCSGRVEVPVRPGIYRYEVERGPEYERASGQVTVPEGQEETLAVVLKRMIRLRDDGWYSGDLHVHRAVEDVELLMQAEDLNFAPVITWWNTRNAWQKTPLPAETTVRVNEHCVYDVMAGEDEREGGALLYFGLKRPLDIQASSREIPSPMQFVERARRISSRVWIDIEKPFWWDVPVWLASEQMNSIGLANNHMCRSRMYEDEAWGRPRDERRLAAPRGNGFWTQEIYYHILNCGLRIPPSAGSASGVLPNPVGYNRVYVHLDEPFSRDAFYRGLARGESFVTNGPVLLATADQQRPGSVCRLKSGESRTISIDVRTLSRDRLSRLEVIQNGRVVRTIERGEERSSEHRVEFAIDGAGWFLVRAIADVEHTFRFASTAPWFVETDDQRQRISRASARFFVEWVDERIERLQAGVTDSFERAELMLWHGRAREFWAAKVRAANAN